MDENKTVAENAANPSLTELEVDTIGEILNISMGSAATAISTMLDQKVTISTPHVILRGFSRTDYVELEPAMLVKINYVEGIHGQNVMVFRQRDMQTILCLLMGNDQPSDDVELDELSISAACEVMNQMMGASATALSEFLGLSINISTPEASTVASNESYHEAIGASEGDEIVSISFRITIDGVMDSNFASILSLDLARNIISQGMGEQEKAMAKIVPPKGSQQRETPAPAPQQTPAPPAPPAPPVEEYTPALEASTPPAPVYTAPPVTPPVYTTPVPQPAYQQPAVRVPINVQGTQFPQFTHAAAKAPNAGGNIDFLMGVSLNVSVEIGKTKRKLKEIVEFGQGTVIELNKQAGAPVDIVVNGCLLARGDVVVIDDNFGVRITEIVGSRELMETLKDGTDA